MLGRTINGYTIIEFKGKGSFGTVYKCKKDEQIYAIKIFSMEYIYDEYLNGEDNRITREIEALKIVDSPYVVRYVDDGKYVENGWEYIYVVMDYVEGDDIANVLKNNGKFTFNKAIAIFEQIVEGIDAIHKSNIVHRDLKPANIYLLKNNSVKILDFGLSKLIDFTSITSTGAIIGSPLYMSPEQITDSKNIDYRSDYYALGVILFEMVSGKNPYGEITSREELYYKIQKEPPYSIRYYEPTIENRIDNLLSTLLEKLNYKRPNSIAEIKKYLLTSEKTDTHETVTFSPSFFVRLWNEKTVLQEFYQDDYSIENAVFPINHQNRQKNLLKILKNEDIFYFIDPATMRLAYDSYSEVKGLIELEYAPRDLSRLELEDLKSYESKKIYVQKVVDEQIKHNPNAIVAPFHVSNNSNLVKIKMDTSENWFSMDSKLVGETKDYLNKINYQGKLIGGFCIKAEVLTTKTEREYFLNVLSSLECDCYWVYVDCIDFNSNISQLYNYALTLLELQKATNKPVIAGRVGEFGLVLLAFGLYGFEAGTSRFESFYEDLYKEVSDPYNMYVRYYVPELLRSIAILRKNPAKIINMLKSSVGEHIKCDCPYCNGVSPSSFTNEKLTRKHFLYCRNKDIDELRSFEKLEDRVSYIEDRIKKAIGYYKELRPIFKDEDSKYLKNWLEVITKLKERWL
ncbi:serine/threonine-protein kinase [Vallitalea sp.]|uniref:serine/threonine-protein kinase n=1 Tax=Vallitalea sp. TaxID=1882829 RepID=UPI0025DE1A32|nr:serine/threonine-protein kinase [Vallitalea sp.]MCT4686801.1 serine/threonine protein kinase [Vallitalea sp.]